MQTHPTEIWKTVKEFPDYEVSNLGRIKRIRSWYGNPTNKPLKIRIAYGRCKYFLVTFSFKNKCYIRFVHRVIAQAFIPNPENKPFINHVDGNKQNNSIENLEWCTMAENVQHAFATGLNKPHPAIKGEAHYAAKLTEKDVRKIKKLLLKGVTQEKIAKRFKISRSSILMINLGKNWAHIS